jgi:hypothetical protein
VRETLTLCLEWLEWWGAAIRSEDRYTFTFVTGDFFEVSSRDVAEPSIILLELIYGVYDDHKQEKQTHFLHAYVEALPTFVPEVSA